MPRPKGSKNKPKEEFPPLPAVDDEIPIDDEPEFHKNGTVNLKNKKMRAEINAKRKEKEKKKYDDYIEFNELPQELDENAIKQIFPEGKKLNAGYKTKDHPYWTSHTKYNRELVNPKYAAFYAKEHKGKAYKGDYNKDGVDDIVITDSKDHIKYINGYTKKPSKRMQELAYYESEDYKKLDHKNKSGHLQVFNKANYDNWVANLSEEDKRKANETLKKSGFTQFKVTNRSLNEILKGNAETIYNSMIDFLVKKHQIEKRSTLTKQISKSEFCNKIVNAILIRASGVDPASAKNEKQISILISRLKKGYNKDENKSKILEFANKAIESLSTKKSQQILATALYRIMVSKQPKGALYMKIIRLIQKSFEINDEMEKYYKEAYFGKESKNEAAAQE